MTLNIMHANLPIFILLFLKGNPWICGGALIFHTETAISQLTLQAGLTTLTKIDSCWENGGKKSSLQNVPLSCKWENQSPGVALLWSFPRKKTFMGTKCMRCQVRKGNTSMPSVRFQCGSSPTGNSTPWFCGMKMPSLPFPFFFSF